MAELLVAFPDTRNFGGNLKFLIHVYLKHGGDLGIVDYFRMCLNAMRKYDIETMLRKNGITPSKGTLKACDLWNTLKVACSGKEVDIALEAPSTTHQPILLDNPMMIPANTTTLRMSSIVPPT